MWGLGGQQGVGHAPNDPPPSGSASNGCSGQSLGTTSDMRSNLRMWSLLVKGRPAHDKGPDGQFCGCLSAHLPRLRAKSKFRFGAPKRSRGRNRLQLPGANLQPDASVSKPFTMKGSTIIPPTVFDMFVPRDLGL